MRLFWGLIWLLLASAAHTQTLGLTKFEARFFVGDDPGFAEPGFDDSAWAVQPLIEPGGWSVRGATPFNQVLWQRITIPSDALPALNSPAIHIGVIAGAHAVYANGKLVGQMGLYQPAFAGLHSIGSKAMPRVYILPEDILDGSRDLVLAIKFARYVSDDPGVVALPFSMAEFGTALGEAEALTLRFLLFSAVGIFLTLLPASIVVFAYFFTRLSGDLGWLSLTLVLASPQAVLSGNYFLHVGRLPPPLLGLLAVKCAGAAVVAFSQAAFNLVGAPVPRIARGLQILAIVALLLPNYGSDWLDQLFIVFAYLWFATTTVLCGATSLICVKAVIRGELVAIPLSAALLTLWVAIILTLLTSENSVMATIGTSLIETFTFIFSLYLAAIPIVLLLQVRRQLVLAQGEVLVAQENERRRVAYDIHDGVGQWLSTIKLNLQVLRHRHKDTEAELALSEVVGHVDEAISDTRRIAHDLSPAMIEKQGLAAAIRSHADVISRRSPVEVGVMIDSNIDLPATTQGHLYRIFQESLTNATRHGRATNISVELKRQQAGFEMEITDNGIGIGPEIEASGIGLRSMRQRALLFDAEIAIESVAPGGTKIRLVGKSRHKTR